MYRALEVLEKNLPNVEDYLYQSSLNLFNQNRNELFYDITSSYVEGHKCIIAEYGYTRNHRRDKKQIIIGLVTTYDGFPIKCNIYKGNTADKTTVASVVKELKNQFDIDEFVFVGDRGMLTSSNIEEIKKAKQKFVMAIPREWTKKYLEDVVISSDRMNEIIKGELYSKYIDYKKPKEDKNKGYAETDQLLLCLNTQKREDDKLYREKVMNNLKEEFIELNKKANNPKSKIVKKEDL
ncbi:MAG: IS1634 family transposase, partial [Alkaliphilus sp.]